MNKIAIQGHSTRGKDVIKILKSLGGKDLHNFLGNRETCYYFINAGDRIDLCSKKNKLMSLSSHAFYTLEEYEQQFLNNMENKRTIKIDLTTAKEWYKQGGNLREIALQAFSENELQELPKSWEEYCKINPVVYKEYYLHSTQVQICNNPSASRLGNPDTFKTKERAEQFITLNKLLQIRDYYNQGWKPDWTNDDETKYVIISHGNEISRVESWLGNYIFSFKTRELRNEFIQNFKSDLEFIKEFL